MNCHQMMPTVKWEGMLAQMCELELVSRGKGEAQSQAKSHFVGSRRRFALRMHGLQGGSKTEREEVDFLQRPVPK